MKKLTCLATISAFFSALAAVCALFVTLQERDTPYKTVLYQARWGYITDYAEASARLSSALNRAAIGVPADAESPNLLAKMTNDELIATAKLARPAIIAWENYIASTSAIVQPWSDNTAKKLVEAEHEGRRAYECFRILGAYTEEDVVPSGWWNEVRKIAAVPCDGFKHPILENGFDKSAKLALQAMLDELTKDQDQFVPRIVDDRLD